MITWIGLGFLAIVALSYWVAARVGAGSASPVAGLLAGLASALLFLGLYLVGLGMWARSLFIAFVETELPLLTERLLQFVEQFQSFRETI